MNVCRIVTLCLIVSFLFSEAVFAENDVFLCIREIPGGSVDKRAENCIDVQSVSVDFSLDATYHLGSGSAVGRPLISPFSIVKSYDSATVGLSSAVVRGTHLPDVFIKFFETCGTCKPLDKPFLEYELRDVIITRHNVSYLNGGADTSEIVDLSFSKITIHARNKGEDGQAQAPIEFRYDLAAGQEG